MNNGIMKGILILALFIFGILFGLESNKDKPSDTEATNRYIDPTSYIARIEDGKFVFVPIQQESQMSDEVQIDKKKPTDESAIVKDPSIGPVMNKEGILDQIGYHLGDKVSQFTRSALEKSISLFID